MHRYLVFKLKHSRLSTSSSFLHRESKKGDTILQLISSPNIHRFLTSIFHKVV